MCIVNVSYLDCYFIAEINKCVITRSSLINGAIFRMLQFLLLSAFQLHYTILNCKKMEKTINSTIYDSSIFKGRSLTRGNMFDAFHLCVKPHRNLNKPPQSAFTIIIQALTSTVNSVV